jgi:peptidyl-tRNA hydrolase, PTH2 family
MYKQVIVVRKDLKLGAGKIAAQVAHAAIGSMNKALKTSPGIVKEWEYEGSKKVVLKVKDLKELKDIESAVRKDKIPYFIVRDAGCTQVKSGTVTALSIGPIEESKIDKVTKKLKLL